MVCVKGEGYDGVLISEERHVLRSIVTVACTGTVGFVFVVSKLPSQVCS